MLCISAWTHFPFLKAPYRPRRHSVRLQGSFGSAESIVPRPSRPYKHPRSSGRGCLAPRCRCFCHVLIPVVTNRLVFDRCVWREAAEPFENSGLFANKQGFFCLFVLFTLAFSNQKGNRRSAPAAHLQPIYFNFY